MHALAARCSAVQAWFCGATVPRLAQVSVEGEGLKRVNLSLKDLTTLFKKHTVTATLQCTGNRRDMFNDVKPVKGLEWGVGALQALLRLHS